MRELKTLLRLVEQALQSRKADAHLSRCSERERDVRGADPAVPGRQGGGRGRGGQLRRQHPIVSALDESRVNRERLSSILEWTPAIVTMKDLNGVYMYANRRFAQSLGAAREWSGARTKRYSARRRPRRCRSATTKWSRGSRSMQFAEAYVLNGDDGHLELVQVSAARREETRAVHLHSIARHDRTAGHEEQLELFKRALSASNNGIADPGRGGRRIPHRIRVGPVAEPTGLEEANIVGIQLRDLLERIHLRMRASELETLARQTGVQPDGHFTRNLDRSGRDAWLDLRERPRALKERSRAT